MGSPDEVMSLRIIMDENCLFEGKPLYEVIVLKAREMNLAGATVFRGIMGFGANAHLHTAKILRLSEDLPVAIEIIDSQKNIDKIIPFLKEVVKEGIMTLEKVCIIK
ncbi:MAG: DUF190 domain-containing protein [Candidatus Aureabacteria bacterium]|nr:DUF190 domain-containing protein [Candidatus Auribacterota bacterium]